MLLVPNRNTSKIPVWVQFAPPEGVHVVNMQAYMDTHDHLLTLRPEKTPINLRTANQFSVPKPNANITRTLKSVGPTLTKAGGTWAPIRTERSDSNRSSNFIWGRRWNFPGTSSQPLTAERMDHMVLVCPRHEILGGIALGMAVAATALGVFNRVQIQ